MASPSRMRPASSKGPQSKRLYGEIRVYAIGLVNGLGITVVYTDRGEDEKRIISAWRSEAHESRYYWQNVEG
jgi:uncharacterized DUF497 family protein